MRRWPILVTGAALWLFLAALPALADGGPHVAAANSGVSTLTADGCAGCHRAHTAQGEMLINAPTEEELCLSCHGAASTGATTDVMTGVQYASAAAHGTGGTQLGALRGGGFDQARIDAGTPSRLSYLRSATAVSMRPKVGVGAAENVTSSHLAMAANGLTLPNVAWGNGAAGSGAGPTVVDLSCASCHNPHGNGQYRILNTLPSATGLSATWSVKILTVTAATGSITTEISHALLVGDVVTIAGTGTAADGTNRVVATVSSNAFTLTGITIAADAAPANATVTRTSGVKVTDATLPAAGDTRNYTVMQVKSPTATSSADGAEVDYLLYASQVSAAAVSGTFKGIAGTYGPTGGDYFGRTVPWNPSVNNTCDPTVFPAQAGCATARSAPNGRPTSFGPQTSAWCASCHTRYFANSNPVSPGSTTTGASWQYPRPGDSLYNHQHRTDIGKDCLVCHVSHGSNAAMTGTYSGSYTYPNNAASASSRLLKVDNRGTCQMCHDPTGTVLAGTYTGPAPVVP